MTSTSASASALQSSLDKLTISPESQAPKVLTNPVTVADSWEDEATATTNSASAPTAIPISTPSPPPPTPASPTIKTKTTAFDSRYQTLPPFGMSGSADDTRSGGSAARSQALARNAADPDKRPEKTTSTAARLIAAGLGQRAPRRTEEERKYDQAMKVQEKKKRDAAKAEEQKKKDELEKAKKSIWED
ncbi:hypothetical protein Q7P35_010427 [Cladosporium inversicolor]